MNAEPIGTQTQIFNIQDFQTPEEIARAERKRGNYKKKQPKIVITDPYTEMKSLYEVLASYLPIPLFYREERVFTYKNIRAWYMIYFDEEEQVEFPVNEAEIIGTECMDIDDRLKLHRKLIGLLKNGVTFDDAIGRIGE